MRTFKKLYWQQLLSAAKVCHIFASSTSLVEDSRQHVACLTGVVYTATGKTATVRLMLNLCGDGAPANQSLDSLVCTDLASCTNITSLQHISQIHSFS